MHGVFFSLIKRPVSVWALIRKCGNVMWTLTWTVYLATNNAQIHQWHPWTANSLINPIGHDRAQANGTESTCWDAGLETAALDYYAGPNTDDQGEQ